jgi:hypothetical protein
VGQRYRNIQGALWNADWIVDRIFKGTDGIECAGLKSASDPSRRKTLALSVVADTTQFVLVEAPPQVADAEA